MITDAQVEAATEAIMEEAIGRLITQEDAERFARAALAAAQAGAPEHEWDTRADTIRNDALDEAVSLIRNRRTQWEAHTHQDDASRLIIDQLKKQEDQIRAVKSRRPPAETAENDAQRCAACGEYMPPHAPHMCVNWPPAPTYEPARPSEEDVARVLCRQRGYNPDEKFGLQRRWQGWLRDARAVLALLQRGD